MSLEKFAERIEALELSLSTRLEGIEDRIAKLNNTKPEPKQTQDFISINQVADLLQVSIPSVYRLTMQKKIPFRKVHKRLFFSKKEMLDFIDSKKVVKA